MALLQKMLIAAAGLYAVALASVLALRVIFGDQFWWLSLLNTFSHLLFVPLAVLIPLVLVLRARKTAVRMLPLVVIGGLWYAPYFLPKPTVAASGTLIHVLTANVWGNNHNLEQVETWLREVDADIVLLQEISPTYATESLAGLRDVYPYQFNQPDDKRWGGNITLSRYPVVESGFVDLRVPEYPNPQRVVVDVNGQHLAVYNVHLDFPIGSARVNVPIANRYVHFFLGYDDQLRNDQIDRLIEVLAADPLPFIIGGDFNTSDQTPTYNKLAAQMTDTYRAGARGFGGSWPVVAARGGLPGFVPPLIRIDYIWHSEELRTASAWRGEQIGSDHMPMHAVLEVPTE